MSMQYPSARRSRARLAQKTQDAVIRFLCFADEKKAMEERAKCVHKTLSEYLRDCALSPLSRQSTDIPTPIPLSEETLFNSNEQEEEQTFVRKSAENNSARESFSKQVPSKVNGKDLASERTGHARGCGCFACERLRAMLASSTTISGSEKPHKQRAPKSSRVK